MRMYTILKVFVFTVCMAASVATYAGDNVADKAPSRAADVMNKMERFDVERTPHLFTLNVVDYYGLGWKYNTPAKREAYKQTEHYRKQLAELEKVREKMADRVFYVPLFLKKYDNVTPGVLQFHVMDVFITGTPFAIVEPSPLANEEGEIMKSKFRYMNYRYFAQTYDVPVPGEVKDMFVAKGKVNYYLAFRVRGMKHVSDLANVRPAQNLVEVQPLRFLAVHDDGSDTLLYDRELPPAPAVAAALR